MKRGHSDAEVLWLYEHEARELDAACIVKAYLARNFDIDMDIRHIYFGAPDFMRENNPVVIIHPFVYRTTNELVTSKVFELWPDRRHINAAWEQIHYSANEKMKAPSDVTAKTKVLHLAWGGGYENYLTAHGVPKHNVEIVGSPVLSLYSAPYSSKFPNRQQLAESYSLDPAKPWLFVPENYRWAFVGQRLNFYRSLGGDPREIQVLVEFAQRSFELMLQTLVDLASTGCVEVILRPRPATHTRTVMQFAAERGIGDLDKVRIIKDLSVREWILASDATMSSYSTSLIEAAYAHKPVAMFEPITIPESLYCDWYQFVERVHDVSSIANFVNNRNDFRCQQLSQWAEWNLLSQVDTFQRIASLIHNQVRTFSGSRKRYGTFRRMKINASSVNLDTHEMDYIDEGSLHNRYLGWESVINPLDK